jgi:hypothetical protein
VATAARLSDPDRDDRPFSDPVSPYDVIEAWTERIDAEDADGDRCGRVGKRIRSQLTKRARL